MSGIFGIFNRNGKAVDKTVVNTMLNSMSYWDPDESDTYINGPVALGHAMLWNTPESKYEHLPLEKDALVLTMDARIDNRDELMKELELPDCPLEKIGDSEFILAAYRKWGEDCPKHLLGDFTFVIWDEKREQVFCARDHVGIKPFYFYLDNEIFVFANDLKGLMTHRAISQEFNDLAILHFLYDIEDQSQTLFKSIMPLMPATSMKVKYSCYDKKIYWRAEDSPKVHFDTEDEYIQHLRKLLNNSVHVRTRSIFPLASHLSGGLDSSSIAVLAARIMKQKNKKLYAFNWVPAPEVGENPEYYEWSNSKKVAEQENITHKYIALTTEILTQFYFEQNIAFNDKQYIWYEQIVRKEAKVSGIRTILSGWGGDELITNNGNALYTGLFWSKDPFKALKYIYFESQTAKYPIRRFLGKCYRELILHQLPSSFYRRLTGMNQYQWNVLKCAQSKFVLLSEKMKMVQNKVSRRDVHKNQLSRFNQGHIQNRIDSWNASSFQDHIEYRYPLLDKRIIEFALGIPTKLYKQKNYGRYLYRKAVEPILPNEVCWGKTKAEPKRVQRLHKLMFEAQNIWKDRHQAKKFSSHTGDKIDVTKIYKYIEETHDKWGLLNMDQKMESLTVIHRSIMVLQMKI